MSFLKLRRFSRRKVFLSVSTALLFFVTLDWLQRHWSETREVSTASNQRPMRPMFPDAARHSNDMPTPTEWKAYIRRAQDTTELNKLPGTIDLLPESGTGLGSEGKSGVAWQQARLLNSTTCDIPLLHHYDPSLLTYVQLYEYIRCQGNPSVTYIRRNELVFDRQAASRPPYNGSISHCKFKPIYRPKFTATDHNFMTYLAESPAFNTSVRVPHDFVRVACYDTSGHVQHTDFHWLIQRNATTEAAQREKHRSHVAKYGNSSRLSVILLGLDSTSRSNFLRQLPVTNASLKKNSDVVEMTGYSIVGENTFPNMVPFLTGLDSKGLPSGATFDHLNNRTLWSLYSRAGYRTFYAEDAPHIATFDYLNKGFQIPPTEYFNRPFFLALEKEYGLGNSESFCINDKPRASFILDHTMDFLKSYKKEPSFSFSFLTADTHDDPDDAGRFDAIYNNFLKSLLKHGLLENTIFVFFSDHGSRYGEIRETYAGSLEWKLPAMFLAFPPWFRTRHPRIWRNLEINQRRLTSAYDVYATLGKLLYLNEKGIPPPGGVPSGPGRSWLEEVPADRTCSDAGIPIEFCPCQQFQVLDNSADEFLHSVGHYLVRGLNRMLTPVRNLCHTLTLDTTVKGKVAHISDGLDHYRVSFKTFAAEAVTKGNLASFEALVQYNVSQDALQVIGTILRTNAYGKQGDCLDNSPLRPYCHCK